MQRYKMLIISEEVYFTITEDNMQLQHMIYYYSILPLTCTPRYIAKQN